MDKRLHYLKRQEERLERRLGSFEEVNSKLVRGRLLTGALGFLLILTTFARFQAWTGWLSLLVTSLLLAGLAFRHRKLRRGIRRHQIWRQLKRTHRARLENDWDRIPAASEVEQPADHPFAQDLDLFGPHSLHRLLDCSLSDGGSRQLAQFLVLEKPHPRQIRNRQTMVRELSRLPAFRDRLALEGSLISSRKERWNVSVLKSWLDQPPSEYVAGVILVSWLLCALNWFLLLIYLLWGGPPLFVLSATLYIAMQFFWQGRVETSFKSALGLQRIIQQIRGIFSFLESYDFQSRPAVEKLCEVFTDSEGKPSQQLGRLERWVSILSVRGFPPAWLMCNLLIPWDLLALAQLEQTRRQLRNQLVVWLDTWFRLEALTSLATFSDFNRDYAFPEIETKQEHRFVAQGLGHPMIPREQRAVNDFELTEPGQLVLITGSNMSGKSTFLRTVGVNVRLAYAGGPVCASKLSLSLLRVNAVIRVDDSLSEGYSFFYREVQRLRKLLDDLSEPFQPPVLFLIDEIFRGTNNRERLIGGRSYIRELCRHSCMGIVTTHDLDLVELENESDRISNAHFRESIEGNRMTFDYRLHPGPCPTTNALEIMRLEGLPVEGVGE